MGCFCRLQRKAGERPLTLPSYTPNRATIEYERHEQLDEVVTEMGIATNNHWQISQWARSASRLHRNFYDDDLDADAIAAYLEDATNFVSVALQLTGLPPVEA